MKLRSKLLLSATCLLTISVAATATSAYAWFVSNRQATVAINEATVKTNATNLKIVGTSDTGTLSNATDTSTTITSTVTATDISGDGVTFFKPKLAPDFGVEKLVDGQRVTTYNATSISNVTSKPYYHQFKLTFSQDNKDVNTGVFLSSDSSVLLDTTEETKNIGLSLCTRVAFLDENATSLLLYWAPNRAAGDANQSYIKAAYNDNVGPDNSIKAPISIKDGDTTSSVLQSVTAKTDNILYNETIYEKPTDVNDATAKQEKEAANEHLLTLKGTTAKTITVRIWFEGMDKDCNSKYLNDKINANLKFNGVNMDI